MRKELSLTQEQIVEYWGVSTPAGNKWEKGSTYPDITLLPALARLLKKDLNTLLSFKEELSDAEIENFVNALDPIVQEQSYEAAFQIALDKIYQYPTCDALILSSILYLEGALTLYTVPAPDPYRKVFKTFYERLAINDDPETRADAIGMLIFYAREEWVPQNYPLYHNLNDAGDTTFLSSRIAGSLCDELSTKKEYSFLQADFELNELISQVKK